MRNKIHFILLLIIFNSCSTRNLVYLSDIPKDINLTEIIKNTKEPKIQPIDLLSITVSTLNPESNLLFNNGVIPTIGSSAGVGNFTRQINEGYRVDQNGEINFPIIGKIELAGLSLEEATEKMTTLLKTEAKNPIVNIKFINFKITIIGEVNQPGTFPVVNEKINILEAISLSGDLTAYGKRENILLIREIGGERTIIRLDITKSNVLLNPYFYLQQNDVIYVEPVKARAQQASMSRANLSILLSTLSLLTIIISNFL